MANYLILSLQTDEIIPVPANVQNSSLLDEMEEKLLKSLKKFDLSRLELLRNVAVKCEQFIIFMREQSFGSDQRNWPTVCGDVFDTIPILSPFGTCFTSKIDVKY